MAIYQAEERMRRAGRVVAVSVVLCACGGGSSGSGSTAPSQDAGIIASDAGADAGTPTDPPSPPGSGIPSDAGPPPVGSAPDAGTSDGGTAQLPPTDGGAPHDVDPLKELVIVDSSVVLDARAANESDGAWSFRRTVERLTPAGVNPSTLVEGWLRSFRGSSAAGRTVDDRPGVEALLSAWPRKGDGSLDLARAPFRLIAIAGRLDLQSSPNGEGRLIYGLVDPQSGSPGLMTVAFEYALPPLGTGNDRQAWAAHFHALGAHPFGPDYDQALQQLTDTFAVATAFAQLRTNEAAFASPWELREWKLSGAGLAPDWTAENPDQSFDGTQALSQFIVDHQAEVRAGTMDLPSSMLASASLETGAWRFPDDARIDEPLRHAFAMQTCNGCHATETFSAQGFFHVNPLKPPAPGGDGRDRLSRFLLDSELPRRADHLAGLIAGTVASGTGAPTALPALPGSAPHYDVLQVPAPEDGSPVALSNGRVLGNSAANGPWIYDGSMHFLLPGDARNPVALGFNARGDVVGYFAAGGVRRAFVLSNGSAAGFGTLGGSMSAASLVTDRGFVAGLSTVASGTPHGFVLSGSALHDIGGLGGGETFPFALSPGGLITGESQLTASVFRSHAFVWSTSGAMKDLGTLGGNYSRGQTIDDAGFVTGFSTLVPSDEKVHGFTSNGGAMVDLGAAPGLPWSAVTGRTAAGVMVGNIYDVPTPTAQIFTVHAFVFAHDSIVDLNDVAQSPRLLATALGIDDAGHILCTDNQVGATVAHGLLLTPR
jgi:probable HAF family extracellular repeat protein